MQRYGFLASEREGRNVFYQVIEPHEVIDSQAGQLMKYNEKRFLKSTN